MSRRKWSGRGFVSEPGGWRGHAAGEGTDLRTARAQRAPRHWPASPQKPRLQRAGFGLEDARSRLSSWARGRAARCFRGQLVPRGPAGSPGCRLLPCGPGFLGWAGACCRPGCPRAGAQGTPHRPWALRRGRASLSPPATDQAGAQPPMGGPRELSRPAGRHQRLTGAKDVNALWAEQRTVGRLPASVPEEHGNLSLHQHTERGIKRWTGWAPAWGVRWTGTPEQRWGHSALQWTLASTAPVTSR